jgi:hypothetical protein
MDLMRVNCYIHSPVERVFDAVSDHERFFTGGRITLARIVRPGEKDRNGLGCLREIRTTRVRFVEEITSFDRPGSFEYVIRECSLPMRHEGSRLELTRRGDGTEVDWTSSFEVPVPAVGPVLTRMWQNALTVEFTRLLIQAKDRLEKGPHS